MCTIYFKIQLFCIFFSKKCSLFMYFVWFSEWKAIIWINKVILVMNAYYLDELPASEFKYVEFRFEKY